MKKQTNLPASGRKLSLNKKTISNLTVAEMNGQVGGVSMTCTYSCHGSGGHTLHCGGGGTRNGNTCYGQNTRQYTCV
jgi:hypothetical protein